MDIYPIEILLFETDATHIHLIEAIFTEYKIRNHLKIIRDPVRAVAYVRNDGFSRYRSPSDLFLISYPMERHGQRVVDLIMRSPRLNTIPRVILFDSDEQKQTYLQETQQETIFLIKPFSMWSFISVIHHFKELGLSIVSDQAATAV